MNGTDTVALSRKRSQCPGVSHLLLNCQPSSWSGLLLDNKRTTTAIMGAVLGLCSMASWVSIILHLTVRTVLTATGRFSCLDLTNVAVTAQEENVRPTR